MQAMGVDFSVAPYKGDTRLTCISQNGDVDAVMSEDGDMLVVYMCPPVLTKLAEVQTLVQSPKSNGE